MSVKLSNRNPNGKVWTARINYDTLGLREDVHEMKFDNEVIPPIEAIYQRYGTDLVLRAGLVQISNWGNLDVVYRFLYGYTPKELAAVDKSGSRNYWLYNPQEWTRAMVLSMEWDLFCLSYYTLLCTNNTFNSNIWEALINILSILKEDKKILPAILLQCDRPYDEEACEKFWTTICDGLSKKVLGWLNEQTCYRAYEALMQISNILPEDRYQVLEERCCMCWGEIARIRIDEETKKTHTVKELIDFDGEMVFFYKEYFSLASAKNETKEYVWNAIFTFLNTIGEKIFDSGDALGADSVYENALKYAQTNDDVKTILSKRDKISTHVEIAKKQKEKEQNEVEKRRQKKRREDHFIEIAAKVVVTIFAICVILIVVFCILLWIGVLQSLAKTILKIALGIVGVFVVFAMIMNVLDSSK